MLPRLPGDARSLTSRVPGFALGRCGMTATELLAEAHSSLERRRWGEAHARLLAADRVEAFGVDDLEKLAVTAYLVGDDATCAHAWERAHHRLLAAGDVARAARCAFWLAFGSFDRGEAARGGGWLMRAREVEFLTFFLAAVQAVVPGFVTSRCCRSKQPIRTC